MRHHVAFLSCGAVTSKLFEPVTFFLVVLNMGFLASYRFDSSDAFIRNTNRATKGLAFVFLAEVLLRIGYEGEAVAVHQQSF